MLKYIFSLSLIMCSVLLLGQDNVDVKYIKTSEGYTVFADNREPCPVSIKINMTLKNMTSTRGNNKIFVVPGYTNGYEITKLVVKDNSKSSRFDINSVTAMGDHFQKEYDHDYPYDLPYNTGNTHRVMQGYHGKLSHINSYALDFDIPAGGDILAARDGIVIDVMDRNSKSCGQPSCNKFNNYIRIYHSDGTFAEYTHIKRGSSRVQKGSVVTQGQKIASCGNVGWATGPHLHFEVFLLNMDKKVTVPTKFKLRNDLPPIELLEKERYLRDY